MGGSSNENRNYKTYNSYKAAKRKNFEYSIINYQTKFLYLKLESKSIILYILNKNYIPNIEYNLLFVS